MAVADRYVTGQAIYLAECDPGSRADIVIDNNALARPAIVRAKSGSRLNR